MTLDKNIFIHNIYYMLSYAFQSLRQDSYRNISVESFEEIYDLFAMILSKGIATQLKQGLYKEYIDRKDDLKVLRGKIDIQQSMRNVSMHRQVLTCEYDELSENVLLNQIIKSTATLLLRSGKVKKEYKQSLKKELLHFSNVDLIDPKQVRWSRVCFHRNNQTYYMLIHICRLIIDGMLMTTKSGEYKLATFIDEQHMCRLYEKFILEYYRKHYPNLNVSAFQIPWAVDDDFTKMLPVMQSDIHLQKENDVLIIDAKYYSHTTQSQFNKNTIHSNNLYQIFTYVKNKEYTFKDEKHRVAGMLLYARTNEKIQPDQTYQMHGNQISVKTLDLNKPFNELSKQLDDIVKEYFSL